MKPFARILSLFTLLAGLNAYAGEPTVGVVVLHGKGGSPNKFVSGLAATLEQHGMAMANLEMPWSDRRKYDVPVGTAEDEVLAVMASMQSKGVKKIFIAGHSQGGLFALYFAGLHPVAGVIAIAPAGSVDSPLYREKLREPIERARNLFQQGKGQESDRFTDFEAGRGLFTVFTTAANYLSWFTPDGAMNQTQAIRSIKADIPVLFIAPTNDYPGLLMVKDSMFGALPKNPLSKLYEPNSNHLNAPVASTSEIENWIGLVAGK